MELQSENTRDMTRRTGILLIQLGTPAAPTTGAVRPYLREFLSDPRVIDLPWIARFPLVNLVIAPFRAPKSTKIYEELWERGNGASPLKTITRDLREQLDDRLREEGIHVHMAMRYQTPAITDVLEEMRRENYDRIVVLPLYPHYASSSSGTAIQRALEIISKWWVIPELVVVNQFYTEDFYLDTLAEQAKRHDLDSFDHVLMSYHGLPTRHVDKVYAEQTDLCEHHDCETVIEEHNKYCYKAAVYATSRSLAERMGLGSEDYTVCFQSRLTDKWIAPFSDEVIRAHGERGHKRLLVLSPAFVADCLETLVEISSEYQKIFVEHGGEHIQLVSSCNTEPLWVDGLADYIRLQSRSWNRGSSPTN